MSELETSASERDSTNSPEVRAEQVHAGEILKRAREAAGLHIAALAVMLKIPVKKLEALEANRIDLFPDTVFIRALASSVCRALKIDAAPVLARLPQTEAPKFPVQGSGINQPFRAPSDGPGPTLWAQVSRPPVLAGLVLLLGALVLILLPVIKSGVVEVKSEAAEGRLTNFATLKNTFSATNMVNAELEKTVPSALQSNGPLAAVASVASSTSATSATSSTSSTASGAAALVQAVSAASPSVSSVSSSLTPKMSTLATATASGPLTTPSVTVGMSGMSAGSATTTGLAAPKPPLTNDIVVFTVKGPSWIEATDAKGQVVLSRVLNSGEIAGAAGALPLKVVVGRANETLVQIRGKAFDLNAVAKDNVARFEVK